MYGKLFESMFDGTLATRGPWQALVTFQQLIIFADRHGVIDMTPEAISRRTTIPLEIIQEGIAALEQPDPDSRTPDEEGRRIVPLSDTRTWGWRIVNHARYRAIRSQEERRAYMRQYQRERRKGKDVNQSVNNVSNVNQSSKQKAVSRKQKGVPTADAVGVPDGTPPSASRLVVPACPHRDIIDLYAKHLPMGRQVKVELWNGNRAKHLQARWRELRERQSLDWWDKFFAHCARSPFLTGKVSSPGREPFEVSLDWLIKPENITKVTEGAYDQRRAA